MSWNKFFNWYINKYTNGTILIIGWFVLLGIVILSPIIGINLSGEMTPVWWILLSSWVFYMIGLVSFLMVIDWLIKKIKGR